MRKILAGLMLGATVLCSTVPAFADVEYGETICDATIETINGRLSDRGVIADENEGVIKIRYACDGIALSDATITIKKVASVDIALGRYIPIDILQDKYTNELILENATANDLLVMAQDMSVLMADEGGLSKTTGEDGTVTFEGIDTGLYLIEETAKAGVSAEYYTFAPYLLSVPTLDEVGDPLVVSNEGIVMYYVESLPKTTTSKIPEETTPSETPSETESAPTPIAGLEFESGNVIMVFGICFGVVALICLICGLAMCPMIIKRIKVLDEKRDNDKNME